MLNKKEVEAQMFVSECLETLPGVPRFFEITIAADAPYWDRNRVPSTCYFETISQFLDSEVYVINALYEIVNLTPVDVNHWQFMHN